MDTSTETHESERPVLERNGTKIARLAVGVLVCSALLGGMLFGLDRLVNRTIRREIQERQLQPASLALRKLRADEQARLGHYQWVDQKNGIVRIPAERAMEQVLKEWESRPIGHRAATP